MRTLRFMGMGVIWFAFAFFCGAEVHSGYGIAVDLSGQSNVRIIQEGVENGGWSFDAEVEYFTLEPRVVLRGHYITRQSLDSDSLLSYRIFGHDDDVLVTEGRRSQWQATPDGGLQADFEIDILQVLGDPTLRTVTVRFDAVVEYEYWYREKYPEIPFPEIRITNLPVRDHFEPDWVWIPRFLPAGIRAKIPAKFKASVLATDTSQFVPALDVTTMDGALRVPSKRIAMTEPLETQFRGWLPLDPHDAGTVMVRPGLVWENVRWYDAFDWFERQPVTFISPIGYGALVWIGLIAFWWSRSSFELIERRGWSRIALVLWGLSAVWFAAHLVISGFWIVVVFYAAVACCARGENDRARLGTYGATWAFFVFMELYWSRLQGSVATTPGGVWLSIAVWALLLLPLMAIRRAGIRHAAALGLTLIWTGATFAAVVYFEFFQDYPSIESLAYAGQVGELGDSVTSLIKGSHVLPFFVWATGVAIFAGRRFQRKTQIEKT